MTWATFLIFLLADAGISRIMWRRAQGSRILSGLSNLYGMLLGGIYIGVVNGEGPVVFSYDYDERFEPQFYMVMAVCVAMIVFHVWHAR
ncbi:hypothetical protein HU751_004305 [Pseudomonas sp. BW13M1]|jgi:branched-subunit amino acid ABC-type transport system permease component|uniref:Uncharacterized protein n=1 Tax=Pseudomonas peradeniyensis TaxID=2745488 RepID=A0A923G5R0_9PSED|nr:hypothetical protein [Pseudomonas peradeniyensis]MBV4504060.1 hypothetical protein [Pseudomonas peradeniyensis]